MQQKQPEEKLFLKHFPHSIKPKPFTPQILADKTSVPLFSNALTKVCFQSCTQQGCYQLFVLSSADSQPVLCLHVMSIFAKKFLLILNKKPSFFPLWVTSLNRVQTIPYQCVSSMCRHTDGSALGFGDVTTVFTPPMSWTDQQPETLELSRCS